MAEAHTETVPDILDASDGPASPAAPLVTLAPPARPASYDAATRAALDHLDGQAARAVADGRPERTRRGYAQDWAAWRAFCADSGVPELAVTAGTLVLFVEWLWERPGWKEGTRTAPSTVDRRISGTVVTARTEHGLALDSGVARLARDRLRQLVREMEAAGERRGRGQASPLLVEHLVRISAACPDDLMGLRDRALVLMHFAVAGREHELALSRVRDYADDPGGLLAHLRVSKVRPRTVPVPYGSRPSVCPVRAWREWKEAAGLDDPDGRAWRRLHSRWRTPFKDGSGLSPEAVGDVITRAGARAGIAIRFTGHSPRRGLATSSRLGGHDQIVIARQGGWAPHSKVLAGYLDVVDQWEDNALTGVL